MLALCRHSPRNASYSFGFAALWMPAEAGMTGCG